MTPLRVCLRRVTSSTLVCQSGAGEGGADGEVEMQGINQVAKQDKEDRVIQWQEKVFSQVFLAIILYCFPSVNMMHTVSVSVSHSLSLSLSLLLMPVCI